MATFLAGLISLMSVGITALIALVVLFFLLRGSRGRYVGSCTYVIDSFSLNPSAVGDQTFIHVAGRQKGLISRLMTLMGVEPRVDVTVTGKAWNKRAGSLAGMVSTMTPLGQVTETVGGYQRSLPALFLAVCFALQAIWDFLETLFRLWSVLAANSEGARESASSLLSTSLYGVLVWLILFGVAAAWYYFSKRIAFGVTAEHTSSIAFKRSLIGDRVVEREKVEQAISLLNQLVSAAYYGEPGTGIPSLSSASQIDGENSSARPWIIAGLYTAACAVLFMTAVLLGQYGSGVALSIHSKPAGVAVWLDKNYEGTTDNTGNLPVSTRRYLTTSS